MNVYAALETLNHHVKDVTKLSEYLYFCDCAVKSNCKFWIDDPDKHYQVRQLLEKADELDRFAKEHYGVDLQAVKNYKFGTVEEVVPEEYKDPTKAQGDGMCWDEWDAWLEGEVEDEVDIEVEIPKKEVMYDEFVLPDMSLVDLSSLRQRVKADKDFIYELKDIVLNYALEEGETEGVQIKITGCDEKHGKRYVSLIVKTCDGTYKFHRPVDSVEDDSRKIKSFVDFEMKIWNLPCATVAAALKVVKHFVDIHHLNSKENPNEKDS
jgi:hypothetical protein